MVERYEHTLPEVLAKRAQEDGDRAYLEDVTGLSLTYGAADAETRRWAAALRSLGVDPGDRVLTMLPNSPEALLAWAGASAIRAIDCGVNNEYRGRMLSYLIENTGARVAVVAERFLDRFLSAMPADVPLRTILVPGSEGASTDSGVDIRPAEDVLSTVVPLVDLEPPAPWDTCYLIYTSGTTGPSKGVLTSWAQLYSQATASIALEDLTPDDAYYCPFPLAHGSGRMPAYLMALAGGRLVVRERFSGTEFWADVHRHGCTTAALVGAMTSFLMAQPREVGDADNPLRQAVMIPLTPDHREFASRFGVRLRTCFSMTEISPPVVSDWDPADHRSCGQLRKGYPGAEVRLVDDNDLQVPVGEVGEMLVRTSVPWTLMSGYFNMPEATARAWRNGWLHTGDAFREDAEGNYYFVDRIKDAIRRRGENISSFEVEAAVNEHPEVAESAAVAVPSTWGEDEVKIAVVRTTGSAITERELVEWLAPRMPRFMLPRYVEFIDELPKTEATLRVRKVELRAAGVSSKTWDREKAGLKVAL